jgi:hypothetical protein
VLDPRGRGLLSRPRARGAHPPNLRTLLRLIGLDAKQAAGKEIPSGLYRG